jgi:hypothetical protein
MIRQEQQRQRVIRWTSHGLMIGMLLAVRIILAGL